ATRCHQFGAIAAWEAVYNLRLRVSEASACAGVLPAQSRAQPPDGMTPIPGRMERHGPNTIYSPAARPGPIAPVPILLRIAPCHSEEIMALLPPSPQTWDESRISMGLKSYSPPSCIEIHCSGAALCSAPPSVDVTNYL